MRRSVGVRQKVDPEARSVPADPRERRIRQRRSRQTGWFLRLSQEPRNKPETGHENERMVSSVHGWQVKFHRF
jgi:hypothetical protein